MRGWSQRFLPLTLLLALTQPVAGQVEDRSGSQQGMERAAGQAIPLEQLRQAASEGAAAAQYLLALRLERGTGVLQNYSQALQWFTAAAQQGHRRAQQRLGHYYHSGLGGVQDRAAARHWLELAAREGQEGTATDWSSADRAQVLMDLAAVLEQGAGQSETGQNETGQNETKQADLRRAAELYRQAADLGLLEAVTSLGVMYQNGSGMPQDFAAALRLYEQAAAAGQARAQNNLGLLYVRGNGVVQDYTRAAALFQAAAEQGLAVAMGNLATMYENGYGVPLDEALAADLYRRAGRADSASARRNLQPGAIFDARLVPPGEDAETLARLRQGAERGDPLAQFLLGWVLLKQDALSQADRAQVAELLQAAAQVGYPPAMANLGLMYVEGRALPQDYVLGYMWLVLAASAGQEEAAALTAELSRRMTQAQIAEAQDWASRWNP